MLGSKDLKNAELATFVRAVFAIAGRRRIAIKPAWNIRTRGLWAIEHTSCWRATGGTRPRLSQQVRLPSAERRLTGSPVYSRVEQFEGDQG